MSQRGSRAENKEKRVLNEIFFYISTLNKPLDKPKKMGTVFSSNSSLDERVGRSLEIMRLKEEIESLKQDNNELRREMMRELNRGSRLRRAGEAENGGRQASEVSVLEVDSFVDKLLADPATNLSMVPDFIERPAQRTTLLFMLKAIAHALDSSSVEFFGHKIVMRMQPMREPLVNDGGSDDELPQYGSYHEEDYRGVNDEEDDEDDEDDGKNKKEAINVNGIPL